MVDSQNRFFDVYVRLPRSVNGSYVLKKYRLYHHALCCNFSLGLTTKARACKVVGQK